MFFYLCYYVMLYIKHPNKIFISIFLPLLRILFIPLLISDILIEIYHHVFFPLYQVPCIPRKNYIQVMDRARLTYLNIPQKLYCMYCGYANGLVHYRVEIGWATEHYRCGIQHWERKNFVPEEHQKNFSKFWDEKDFIKKYCRKEAIK